MFGLLKDAAVPNGDFASTTPPITQKEKHITADQRKALTECLKLLRDSPGSL